MARPLRLEFPGAVYHVVSRGNDRMTIFFDDDDRRLFLRTLDRTIQRWRWECHAYCLMGNYYHLLIETPEPTLCRGMRQLNGEYSQAFNRRHDRNGHLFQGRYKAVLVEKESHLLEVCRYIVLNPVRSERDPVPRAQDWPWSSYRATGGWESRPPWLAVSWVLRRFGKQAAKARQAYRRFVEEGVGRKPSFKPLSGLYIGSERFGERLQSLVEEKEDLQEYPRWQRTHGAKGPGIAVFFPPEIRGRKEKRARNESIYRAYVEGGFKQREIAEYLGLHYVTVSGIVRAEEERRRGTEGEGMLKVKA